MDAISRERGFNHPRALRDLARLRTSFVTEFRYHLIIGGAWSIPVALTLLSASQEIILASAVIAAVLSGGVILLEPKAALIALPFLALLSPVAGFLEIYDAHLLLSDLLFVLLGVELLVLAFQKQVTYSNAFDPLLIIVAVLSLGSCLVGFLMGTLVTVKPLLFLIQLAIVYFYTATFAKDDTGWSLVINAWLVAGFFGALLLIHAFITGQPLNNFRYGFDAQLMGRENLSYLFQATYYYTGFHYILGISIVILFLRVLLCTSNWTRLFLVSVLAVFVLALSMMMNKTAMFSVAIAIAAILLLSFYVQKKKIVKLFLLLIAFLGVASIIVLGGVLQYIGESQADLWMRRLFGASPARLEVYVQAFTSWFSYPLQIFAGMGPDFLDGSGDTSMSAAFKFSNVTGLTEGTVDSGWISYLIELGVITFVVLVALFVRSTSSVLRYLKQMSDDNMQNTQAIYVLGSLFFIAVALLTQMLGYTKLTWLPFQLLIIGLMHKNLCVSNKGGRERSSVAFPPAGPRLHAPHGY